MNEYGWNINRKAKGWKLNRLYCWVEVRSGVSRLEVGGSSLGHSCSWNDAGLSLIARIQLLLLWSLKEQVIWREGSLFR
jgi:hypothetical protein